MDLAIKTREKHCFIVTVGTSLSGENGAFANYELGQSQDETYQKSLIEENYTSTPYDDNLSGQVRTVATHIHNCGNTLINHGAELNALYKKEPIPQKEDAVILIATRTRAGDYCSDILKNIFDCLDIQCLIIRPKYLGLADDPVFVSKGLPEFLNACYDAIKSRKKDGFKVILCPNGGYKALIPYVTLAGLLEGLEIRYIYDDSEQAMALPRLPVGPDMAAFDEHLWRIENILCEKDEGKRKKDIASLPEDLRTLFGEGYAMSSLGTFLWKVYLDHAAMTPLRRATSSKRLLAHLNDDLRAKFIALAELDHLIWKGDRVPEMVEHAARHHTNLFRIAQQILLPCFESSSDDFLSPEELFTLLSALLLHDCGHVVGSVPWDWDNRKKVGNERLFPGEIREYHNILGYMRLRNGCKCDSLDPIYEELKNSDAWKDLEPCDAWKSYLAATATAGLYHRQAMPLRNGAAPFTDCGFYDAGGVTPLESISVQVKSKTILPARMLLVVALLRLIDSLDVQHSRAGGRAYVEFHLSAIEGEIEELAGRISELKASGSLAGEESSAVEKVAEGSKVNEETKKDRECLKKLANHYSPKAYLIRFYYELLLAKRFKEIQKEHYAKHMPVSRISIRCESSSPIAFVIDMEISEDLYKKYPTIKCGNPISIDEFKNDCLKELSNEFEKIKDILSEAQITLKYGA